MAINENHRVLVLYASQTGQSQSIAEIIASEAKEKGFDADLQCVSGYDTKFTLTKEKCVVMVSSSTGEGDPPDSAVKMWRKIKRKTTPTDTLAVVNFAVLALGDSNYNSFMGHPKYLETRWQELGAHKFYNTGYADEAVGLESVVEPWKEGLFDVLEDFFEGKITPFCDLEKPEETNDALPTALHTPSDSKLTNGDVQLTLGTTVEAVLDQLTLEDTPTLLWNSKLKELKLTLPVKGKQWLEIETVDCVDELEKANLVENGGKFPCSISDVHMVPLVSGQVLTSPDSSKPVYEIGLDLAGLNVDYEPGDSFGVVCNNLTTEVTWLIERLDLTPKADEPIRLKYIEAANKKPAGLPSFLPSHATTLRMILTTAVDIRIVPKKVTLFQLSIHCRDERQRRRLEELSSREGSEDYLKLVVESKLNLLDVLAAFDTCFLPVDALLELLFQRLAARAYSFSSSPLDGTIAKFVFTEVCSPGDETVRRRDRHGVCTSWLKDLALNCQNNTQITLPVFLRTKTSFCLPVEDSQPIIMVGPGSGVAPFLGFLRHRRQQLEREPGRKFGRSLLFFGCRKKTADFIFEEEFTALVTAGVLSKMLVAFSRDEDSTAKYVQDNIAAMGAELVDLLTNQKAVIYVCGDAKNMSRDVRNAFIKVLQTHAGMSETEGAEFVNKLTTSKRYLQDVWT